jgi:hypothetical protein
MKRKQIPPEAIISLRQRLENLPPRASERRKLIEETAITYGVSQDTVYRSLRERAKPKSINRNDRGKSRKISAVEMERYCEIIAAMKIRSLNKKGRHLSTIRAISILETEGMETPYGYLKLTPGLLNKSSVNHYLKTWDYDLDSLTQPTPAVRFQANHSNECWQFDLSPSDLKYLKNPSWVQPGRGNPQLMLYSVVDDRSGVCYQEYHCVYGEDVEAALRFLFNAMTEKSMEGFTFSGIPAMIYMDNGPIAKSRIFQTVMEYLGVKVVTHLPNSKDKRRNTARAKGKVERAFRTVKEAHETLYHFHEPETETEANTWLHQYLIHYNNQRHRHEEHTRLEDWLLNAAPEGIRQMCSWERFCTFAREPERRKVGIDARVTIEGVAYEVNPDLAGETVTLLWGLFDNELYIDNEGQKYGPYFPVGGPIPLHRYRTTKKTKKDKKAERIEKLAQELGLPISSLPNSKELQFLTSHIQKLPTLIPFNDPDPFQEFTYPSPLDAKRAIANYLNKPLAKLNQEQMTFVNELLTRTLNKKKIIDSVKEYFHSQEKNHAD